MLVLSRRKSEIIRIGDEISVQVVRIGPKTVRLGITAKPGVPIVREELADEDGKSRPQLS